MTGTYIPISRSLTKPQKIPSGVAAIVRLTRLSSYNQAISEYAFDLIMNLSNATEK